MLLLMHACTHEDVRLIHVGLHCRLRLSFSESVSQMTVTRLRKQQLHAAGCMCKRAFFPRLLPCSQGFSAASICTGAKARSVVTHGQRHASRTMNGWNWWKKERKNNNYHHHHHAPKPAACWWTAGSQCAWSLIKAIINFWSATVLTRYMRISIYLYVHKCTNGYIKQTHLKLCLVKAPTPKPKKHGLSAMVPYFSLITNQHQPAFQPQQWSSEQVAYQTRGKGEAFLGV